MDFFARGDLGASGTANLSVPAIAAAILAQWGQNTAGQSTVEVNVPGIYQPYTEAVDYGSNGYNPAYLSYNESPTESNFLTNSHTVYAVYD